MVLLSKQRLGSRLKNPLLVFRQYAGIPVSLSALRRLALSMYKKEGIQVIRRISLVFCSDHTIRKLNKQYRDIDRATDVLSFALGDDDLLGEIYISLERAKVQARRYDSSLDTEIKRLFVHGFFHLLGHDHKKSGERIAMENKESFYR